jgi:Mg2+ and Co2+ transporter CorA
MKISVWEKGKLREAIINELHSTNKKKLWFDIVDPSVEEMEGLTEAFRVPRNVLLGKLSSNYPHVDSYPEYTKIFVWYLNTEGTGKDLTNDMGPIIIFTNGQSVVSISHTWTKTSEAIASEIESPRYAQLSLIARVTYLTLNHTLESYEHYVDRFEALLETFENRALPWPRSFDREAFIIRRETSSLLRLLRHLKRLAEALTDDHTELGISDVEKRLFDIILERVIGAEETAETTENSMRDLISMHMDMLSDDMSRTMRLIAAFTVMIGVPSLIGSLLGANITQMPDLSLWQEMAISATAAGVLALYFYTKGWLKMN